MKDKLEQIKYTDNLLILFGFKGINDYETVIKLSEVSGIKQINETIPEFKKHFSTKRFNLNRTGYEIKTSKQAVSFLKNCLEYIGCNYEIFRKDNKSCMRLKSDNLLLKYYIRQKEMSDIRQKEIIKTHEENTKIIKNLETVLDNTDNEYIKTRNLLEYKVLARNGNKKLIKCKAKTELKKIFRDRLKLNMLDATVKKITLLNLPSKYTYVLYINNKKTTTSKLLGNYQVFDFSDNNEDQLDLWILCGTSNINKYFDEKQKKSYLNIFRFEDVSIDIINDDIYDNYHIYNPRFGKYYQNEYKFLIDGIYYDENDKKLVEYEKEYSIYPNHTYIIPLCTNVKKIWLDSLNYGMDVNHYILLYSTKLIPTDNCYNFNNNLKTEQFFENKINSYEYLKNLSKCSFNYDLEKFPDHKEYIENNMISLSRSWYSVIVFDCFKKPFIDLYPIINYSYYDII